jgi:hypothetical protein
MTEGIIDKVFQHYIDYNILREDTTTMLETLKQELKAEIKMLMVSLYEQNPLFQANALKLIQRELIGNGEKKE